MNKQAKDILGLIIITMPIFAMLFIGWHYTPMYKEVKEQARIEAYNYLIQTYYDTNHPAERQALIENYGLTEETNRSFLQWD